MNRDQERRLRETAQQISDKTQRDYPQSKLRPAKVLACDTDESASLIYMTVQLSGEKNGNPITCVSLMGVAPVGETVMVLWEPPQQFFVLAPLSRQADSVVPSGFATCNENVSVIDFAGPGPSYFVLVPMDELKASPSFLSYFEGTDYGWRALRPCSVQVDYSAAWATDVLVAGAYQTALLSSSGIGNCSALNTGVTYACGDNHYWGAEVVASAGVAALPAWWHTGSMKLSLEPDDELAVGARWFSDSGAEDPQELSAATSCGRDSTARLAVSIIDYVDEPAESGGES